MIVCELMRKGDLHHYLPSLRPQYVMCVLHIADQSDIASLLAIRL